MKLEKYVGKIFRHTPKAIRRGEPATRLFFVVDVVEDEGKKWLVAWKVELERNGYIWHPAYGRRNILLSEALKNRAKSFAKSARNGSTPTAMFRPDSLYIEVDGNSLLRNRGNNGIQT